MFNKINCITKNKNCTNDLKRSDLFNLLKTHHENPDYSCIEIYWEILRPMGLNLCNTAVFAVSACQISSELAPQDKNKSYYTYQTIRRKLKKLEDYKLIKIYGISRFSGCEYTTPRYVFELKTL